MPPHALLAALIAVAPPLEPELPAIEPAQEGADPLVVIGTSVAIVGAIAAWGYGAWWDEDLRSFHFTETGFLGRNTYAGGADKLGHTYVCYITTLGVSRLYELLGMSHETAALVSAGAVFMVSNGIELTDGFTDYGFEYGDVIANSLGIGFALADELSPAFSSMFGMRLGYVPSRDFLAHDKTFIKWINDYTGMIYYLDVKAKGVLEAFDVEPGLARYLVAGLVWGTDKYSPVRVHEERRRAFGVHVGLSLSELLRSGYPEDEGVEAFATFFDYYAVPFLSVAVLNDLNSGEWVLNFGVSNRVEIGL